jgi:uncharacterized protein involved in type VI secretion and phage assembly
MMDMEILAGLVTPPGQQGRFYGVTVGIVTNNQDPDGLGRVKVKLPWLSEEHESHWARLLTPMAGPERGLYCLPEVDDEVLVAFEHGQVEFPYVLGGLWNGKDKPPEQNDDGQNNKRTLKSRSGHVITLDDTQGQEKIVIRDKTGKNEIVIDSAKNSLTIKVQGDFSVEAQGKISLKSAQDLAVESQANSQVKGSQLALEGTAKAELKAPNVSLNGSAQTEVKGGAMVQVQGGLVKIN